MLYYAIKDKIPIYPIHNNDLKDQKHNLQNNNIGRFIVNYITFSFFNHPDELAQQYQWKSPSCIIKKYNQDKKSFNPITATYYALVIWNKYNRSRDKKYLDQFKLLINFMEEIGKEKDNQLIFEYQFDYPRFNLKAPWHSGITQGQALSCFIRYNLLGGSNHTKQKIDKIYNSLLHPEDQNGILSLMQDKRPWIEEYPNSSSRHVLNGFLFALIALYEYNHHFPKNSSYQILEDLTDSFFRNYNLFVRGKDLRYSSERIVLANIQYQGLHAFQMYHLYQLSGQLEFRQIGEAWLEKVDWNLFEHFHGIKNSSDQRKILSKL
jgi:hypothetical protein